MLSYVAAKTLDRRTYFPPRAAHCYGGSGSPPTVVVEFFHKYKRDYEDEQADS